MITGERPRSPTATARRSPGFNEAPDDHGGEALGDILGEALDAASMRPPMITGEREDRIAFYIVMEIELQ